MVAVNLRGKKQSLIFKKFFFAFLFVLFYFFLFFCCFFVRGIGEEKDETKKHKTMAGILKLGCKSRGSALSERLKWK